MITKLIMVLLMVTIGFSEWRWADDTIELTHDKEAHFVGSAGAYFFFRHKDYTIKESVLYTFYLGLTKECIDAVVPWEKYGAWGGDGFSKYDLYYNVVGIVTAYAIDKLWKPRGDNSELKYRLGWNSICITFRLHR